MSLNQQEPIFTYQEELETETKKTFGFSLYQGQPYIMSFRDLLNDMLKEGMTVEALKVLFTHCRRENKTHTNYFRVVVNKWLKKGITTQQEAKKALRDYRMSKFNTVICKRPKYDCLQKECHFKEDCPLFTVLHYFDEKINPEVSAATLEDKKMIEDRLNSIFSPSHLLKAIDNFAKSNYRKQGESRLSFLFNCDSYTKDWVNRVIKKQNSSSDSQVQAGTEASVGEDLSKEESMAYLERLINSNPTEGDKNHD